MSIEHALETSAREEVEDAQETEQRQNKGSHEPSVEQTPRRMLTGITFTLLGGVLWGVNGSVSKILMDGYGVNPLWLGCVRELGAGIMFLTCAAIATPHSLLAALKDVRAYPKYIGLAISCSLFVQCAYLFSIHWTNAGTATVLQTLNLIMVLCYVCIHGKRKPSIREILGVALAFGGVVLIATGGSFSSLSLPLPGLMWGLIDALSCACLAILPLKMIAQYGNFVFNGLVFFISGLILTPIVRPWQHFPTFDTRGWVLLAFTIIVGTFVAFWLFMAGIVRVGSMRATLLGTIEPVVATITAVVWTGAVFVPTDIAGFIMILIMVFLVQ